MEAYPRAAMERAMKVQDVMLQATLVSPSTRGVGLCLGTIEAAMSQPSGLFIFVAKTRALKERL
jgi:hypothetical protein